MYNFESVLLGRNNGFGESVILKLPNHELGIIDSCVNKRTKEPAAYEYLIKHELDPNKVKFIILTHFHQDHYLGIANLLELCINAKFYTSSSLYCSEFDFLLNSFGQIEGILNPFIEFFKIGEILENTNRKIYPIDSQTGTIYSSEGVNVIIESPSPNTKDYFKLRYNEMVKSLLSGNATIPKKENFNLQSVVVRVNIDNKDYVFGSDLEYSSNQTLGWNPVMENYASLGIKLSLLKVPHHGSVNGYNNSDYLNTMRADSLFKLTPSCKHNLPNDQMILNLKQHTSHLFSTANLSKKYKKMSSRMNKVVNEMNLNIKRMETTFIGSIQIEDSITGFKWELNNGAIEL